MLSRVEHESVIIWLPGCVGSQIFFQASKYMFTDARIDLFQLEEEVMPYLTAFANFRDDVRKVAREQKGSLQYWH